MDNQLAIMIQKYNKPNKTNLQLLFVAYAEENENIKRVEMSIVMHLVYWKTKPEEI